MKTNWNVKKHKRRFIALSTFIFLLVGLGHALRSLYGWEIVIAGWAVPLHISWLAVFVALLMLVMGIVYIRK